MRVLGLDPSTVKFGYGIIDATGDSMAYVGHGVFSAPASWDKSKRLAYLGELIKIMIDEEKPEVCAIEEGYMGDGPATLAIAEARGVGRYLAASHGMKVFMYAPTTIKKVVTGSGKVQKSVLADIVALRLGLKTNPPEDAGDALGAAITHVLGAQK
jgi:crossover junction endodeoxyribonuclease RuvC